LSSRPSKGGENIARVGAGFKDNCTIRVGLLPFVYFRLCIDACGSLGLAMTVRRGFFDFFIIVDCFFNF